MSVTIDLFNAATVAVIVIPVFMVLYHIKPIGRVLRSFLELIQCGWPAMWRIGLGLVFWFSATYLLRCKSIKPDDVCYVASDIMIGFGALAGFFTTIGCFFHAADEQKKRKILSLTFGRSCAILYLEWVRLALCRWSSSYAAGQSGHGCDRAFDSPALHRNLKKKRRNNEC